jgi:hypothetical protein
MARGSRVCRSAFQTDRLDGCGGSLCDGSAIPRRALGPNGVRNYGRPDCGDHLDHPLRASALRCLVSDSNNVLTLLG